MHTMLKLEPLKAPTRAVVVAFTRGLTTGSVDVRRARLADAELHRAAAEWARSPLDSSAPNLVGGWA